FLLEDDSLVEPSALLSDVADADLQPESTRRESRPVFVGEAMLTPPLPAGLVPREAEAWLALRLARTAASDARFRGSVDPRPRRMRPSSARACSVLPLRPALPTSCSRWKRHGPSASSPGGSRIGSRAYSISRMTAERIPSPSAASSIGSTCSRTGRCG